MKGRTSKFTKELVKEITDNLEIGLKREDAWTLAGISSATFYDWLKNKKEFSEAIKRAELACKRRMMGRIQIASRKDWKAAAWWLERKFQDEFALRWRLEHSGKGGGPIKTQNEGPDLSGLSLRQLAALAAAAGVHGKEGG